MLLQGVKGEITMRNSNPELLERLKNYSPDKPGVEFPFSARLARDNGWTREFAFRAIEEYKRFCYLAATSGHPVTPSEEVDEVWHLHMIYTKSYWEDFCAGILRMPFHHNPTEGGEKEGNKFYDWYSRTLESYRLAFGEEPPKDVWPDPEKRFERRCPVVSNGKLNGIKKLLSLPGIKAALLILLGLVAGLVYESFPYKSGPGSPAAHMGVVGNTVRSVADSGFLFVLFICFMILLAIVNIIKGTHKPSCSRCKSTRLERTGAKVNEHLSVYNEEWHCKNCNNSEWRTARKSSSGGFWGGCSGCGSSNDGGDSGCSSGCGGGCGGCGGCGG